MVTKQQQLEWLANTYSKWWFCHDFVRMSVLSIGHRRHDHSANYPYHKITREEWQQERDKMQKRQDNSWHDRGELPPVGCECEVKTSKNNWVKAFTVGTDIDGGMVVQFIDSTIPFSSCAYPSNFRPLRTKREKAIDEMATLAIGCKKYDITQNVAKAVCELLYDAGYRKQ